MQSFHFFQFPLLFIVILKVLWERLYLRWQRDWKQMDGVKQTIMQWKNKEKELQSKVLVLRRSLNILAN